jgi:hypothetical protein
MVGQIGQQGLAIGIAPAQCVEADLPVDKVDLAAHQSVAPMVANQEGSAEQMNVPVIVAAAHENHSPLERGIKVEFEASGKRTATWGALSPQGGLGAVSGDIPLGDGHKAFDIGAVVALPHLALPKGVKAFNGVLEPRLARRGEQG